MKRTYLNICTFVALALAATSCTMDKLVDSVYSYKPSNTITFGASTPQVEVITRGGESRGTTLDFTESALVSEDGQMSLPMMVKVEQGIHRAVAQQPQTRGEIMTDASKITMLSAWASAKDGSGSRLYIDDVDFTRGSDGIYRSAKPYLWLDAATTLDFFTVANHTESFMPNFNEAGDHITSFDYTVPANAAEQPDLLVAENFGVAGNSEASVPLEFKHILSAVNFKVGSKVVSGTIKSIKLKGVYNKGTYLLDEGQWVDRTVDRTVEDNGEFKVPLPEGGVAVTAGAGENTFVSTTSFMMIPQQLYTGAEVELVFHDNTLNNDVPLRASIQGDVWAMNTTTNYLININGDYGLEIIPLDKVIDSHYVITKVEVSSDYPIWQLNVSTNDGASVTVQPEAEVNTLAKQGFWTDKVVSKSGTEYVITSESARGTANCSGSRVSGQIVYVFIPENVSGAVREITLTLIGAGSESAATKTLTLEQHSVKWIDPTGKGNTDEYWGAELLLEGGQVDWGFCWDGLNATFIMNQGGASYNPETDEYGAGNIPAGQRKKILPAMELAGIDVSKMSTHIYDENGKKEIPNPNYDKDYYIQVASSGHHQYFIRIDLSKVGNIGVAEDYDNGWQNTDELYHFEGIGVLSQLIEFCKSWGDITNPDGRANMLQNSLDYAAMYAMKRNKFYYYEELIPDVGKSMIIPVIFDSDINWYLPAKDQFPTLMQSNWGQVFNWNDSYWTSTAYLDDSSDYSKSYAYINGAETIAYRKDKYLTMALRRKTSTADVVIKPEDVVVPGAGENGTPSGSGGSTGGDTGGNQTGGAN